MDPRTAMIKDSSVKSKILFWLTTIVEVQPAEHSQTNRLTDANESIISLLCSR